MDACRRIAWLACLCVVAMPAYAHDEEVLVGMIVIVGTVVTTCFFLVVIASLKRYSTAGMLGSLAGAALAWMATAGLRGADIVLAILLQIALPVLFAFFAALAQGWLRAKQR
jgi:hypothetical protein